MCKFSCTYLHKMSAGQQKAVTYYLVDPEIIPLCIVSGLRRWDAADIGQMLRRGEDIINLVTPSIVRPCAGSHVSCPMSRPWYLTPSVPPTHYISTSLRPYSLNSEQGRHWICELKSSRALKTMNVKIHDTWCWIEISIDHCTLGIIGCLSSNKI